MRILHIATVLLLILNFNSPLLAKPIPREEAEKLAKSVFKMYAKYPNIGQELSIVSTYTQTMEGIPSYYVFNFEPAGFVVISADDCYNALLAFSDESTFDFSVKEQTEYVLGTLSINELRMDYQRKNNITASAAVQKEWDNLRKADRLTTTRNSEVLGIIVPPMTTTKWNQDKYYNAKCPANASTVNGPDGRTYCGCMPIAVSQLIKFHNYPASGNGSNSYQDPTFGTLSADFCSTNYNWNNMPNTLTNYNDDVAQFIYHVGVSTNTFYSTDYTSTFVSNVRDALVNYFKYDQAADWFYDGQLNLFPQVAKRDLDAGRPILLTGVSRGGGAHAWIADGYGNFSVNNSNTNAEYFHFNWGWGGAYNGWYLDTGSSWGPLPNQTSTLAITYYYDRYVVYNVFPAKEACQKPERGSYYSSIGSDNSAYMYVSYRNGKQDISFRYRAQGTTDWITTNATQETYQYVTNLTAGTTYEYQARRRCCPDAWSDYTATATFKTTGTPPQSTGCVAEAANKLTTSSVTETYAYIYSSLPYGSDKNKQFRYKKTSDANWTTNAMTTSYYNFLSNLSPGTPYEFQVRHECSPGSWSDYSASATFTTAGSPTNNACKVEAASALYTSSVTATYAYVYTVQPNGNDKINQFRYRNSAGGNWIMSDMSNLYYRFLQGLTPNTLYEVQVRHDCGSGNWSNYSDSFYFMTGTAN